MICQSSSFLPVLHGSGDVYEKNTPYFPWKKVFTQLINTTSPPLLQEDTPTEETSNASLATKILQRLQPYPQLLPFAPLLNNVLHVDLPETEISKAIRRQGLIDGKLRLLGWLLQQVCPLVIVLEDCQWFDNSTWTLFSNLVPSIGNNILFILTARIDPTTKLPQEYLNIPDLKHITLESLTIDESTMLLNRILAGIKLTPALEKSVLQKTEGNPFFIQQFGRYLRDNISKQQTIEADFLPDSIFSAIYANIDCLSTEHRQIVNIASVIGKVNEKRDCFSPSFKLNLFVNRIYF